MGLNLVTLGIVVVILLLALRTMIHIVPEYQRLVVLRFGNFEKTAGPGIVLLLPPPIQSVAKTVDLREFVVEIPPEACITRAGVPISLGLLVYQKVVDPKGAFLNTQNVRKNIQASAANTLRAVVADISLDDAHPERDRLTIANEVRVELDEITRRWGVQITNVEIKAPAAPRDEAIPLVVAP